MAEMTEESTVDHYVLLKIDDIRMDRHLTAERKLAKRCPACGDKLTDSNAPKSNRPWREYNNQLREPVLTYSESWHVFDKMSPTLCRYCDLDFYYIVLNFLRYNDPEFDNVELGTWAFLHPGFLSGISAIMESTGKELSIITSKKLDSNDRIRQDLLIRKRLELRDFIEKNYWPISVIKGWEHYVQK